MKKQEIDALSYYAYGQNCPKRFFFLKCFIWIKRNPDLSLLWLSGSLIIWVGLYLGIKIDFQISLVVAIGSISCLCVYIFKLKKKITNLSNGYLILESIGIDLVSSIRDFDPSKYKTNKNIVLNIILEKMGSLKRFEDHLGITTYTNYEERNTSFPTSEIYHDVNESTKIEDWSSVLANLSVVHRIFKEEITEELFDSKPEFFYSIEWTLLKTFQESYFRKKYLMANEMDYRVGCILSRYSIWEKEIMASKIVEFYKYILDKIYKGSVAKYQFEEEFYKADIFLNKLIEKGYLSENSYINSMFLGVDEEFIKCIPRYGTDADHLAHYMWKINSILNDSLSRMKYYEFKCGKYSAQVESFNRQGFIDFLLDELKIRQQYKRVLRKKKEQEE